MPHWNKMGLDDTGLLEYELVGRELLTSGSVTVAEFNKLDGNKDEAYYLEGLVYQTQATAVQKDFWLYFYSGGNVLQVEQTNHAISSAPEHMILYNQTFNAHHLVGTSYTGSAQWFEAYIYSVDQRGPIQIDSRSQVMSDSGNLNAIHNNGYTTTKLNIDTIKVMVEGTSYAYGGGWVELYRKRRI